MAGLQFAAHPTGADRDVGAGGKSIEEFWSFFNWRRQIGIGEENEIAVRMQHAMANAVSLAAVSGIFQQVYGRAPLRIAENNFCGSILRATVHDDDFRLPGLPADKSQHAVQACA